LVLTELQDLGGKVGPLFYSVEGSSGGGGVNVCNYWTKKINCISTLDPQLHGDSQNDKAARLPTPTPYFTEGKTKLRR
jgi:hypothetical protein